MKRTTILLIALGLAACGQVQVHINPPPSVSHTPEGGKPGRPPLPPTPPLPPPPPPPKGPPTATLYWAPPLDFADGTPIEQYDMPATNIYQGPQGAEVMVALAVPGITWTADPKTLIPGTTVCWYVTAETGASNGSLSSPEVCKSF